MIDSLNMLYLGPKEFHPNASSEAANATAKRARDNIFRILQDTQRADEYPDLSNKSPVSLLADLPSLQFLETLSDCFQNTDQAFERGIFKRIQTDAIDLPEHKRAPNSDLSKLWINRLPGYLQPCFSTQHHKYFISPLQEFVNASKQAGSLPNARIYASQQQYVKLLDKAELAGMLHWSIVEQEDPAYTQLAEDIQLTLFAVSKSETRSRLISWPRVQNEALPDPPYTSLPDPSLFEAVKVNGASTSAFYLDVANMFHNIALPRWMSCIFPMKPVKIKALAQETVQRIHARISLEACHQDSLIRPCQASMPMGFKWSVFVAHNSAASCLDQAYYLFKSSLWAPKDIEELQVLKREQVPVTLSRKNPLLLHIIDDVAGLSVDWPPEAAQAWYRISRNVLNVERLPVAEKKSCPLNRIEKNAIDFIGCTWDIEQMTIFPEHKKIRNVITQAREMLGSKTSTIQDWQKVIGKLVWFAMLNRPLLSCAQNIFREVQRQEHHGVIQISSESKREMQMLTALLPLARVDLALPISQLLIAFDASSSAGAVVVTHIPHGLAEALWRDGQRARFAKTYQSPKTSDLVKWVTQSFKWRKALIHCWQKSEHINGLEATAAVLSLEFAIRAGLRNTRMLMITDSFVTLGALQKGRSSAPGMLVRCRRFAALTLAHQLKVTISYVESNLNPADKFTRITIN